LNLDKTRVTSFEEGFRFLGVQFRGAEAMIPWKARRGDGRVLFMARPMPARLLREYRRAPEPQEEEQTPAQVKPRPPLAADRGKATSLDMAYLYVTQQGAILRKSGDRFLVEEDGHIALDLPYHRLDHILIFGNVQVTSQAMAEALDHNIALSLFTRHGRFRGTLTPPAGKNVDLRLAQYAAWKDPARSAGLARGTVAGKLVNSLRVLERYEDRDRASDSSGAERRSIEGTLGRLGEAGSLAELNGHEGAAASAYFDALMRFNRSGFEWSGRVKHPATDPLNALLSLAYTLLMNEFNALIEALGLDPAIGFLHEIDGARPSLALDLMEPFRAPAADRLVLTMVNRRQITVEDFEPRDAHGSLFLKPGTMRMFFEEYEKWMLAPIARVNDRPVTFRSAIRSEVDRFAKTLKSNDPWTPFAFGAGESSAAAAS
jgi:CRISPR-associated protein Cas1